MSVVLASLPDLPALVEPASALNGKPLRIKPRVGLSDLTPNNLGTVKKLHHCLFPVSYSPRFFSDLLDPHLTPEDYSKLVHYQDVPVGVLVSRLEPARWEGARTLREAVEGEKGEKEGGEGEGEKGEGYKLYVMTLGVLFPYRRQGLASKMIHHLLTAAAASHSQPSPPAPSSPSPAPVASTSSSSTPAPPVSNKKFKKVGKKPSAVEEEKKAAEEKAAAEKAEQEKEAKEKEDKEKEDQLPKPRIDSVYLHVQVGNEEGRRFWERWGFEVKDTIPNYYRKIEPRDAWLLERRIEPVVGPAAAASS
ncbi:hypothetical protein JCM8547_001350 [Rhodosporidiobolus lusitaniae]